MAVKLDWDDVSDLSPSEMSSVEEWKEQFDERYDYIGRLVRSVDEIIDTPDISTAETKTGEGSDQSTEEESDEEVEILSTSNDKVKTSTSRQVSHDSSDEVEIINWWSQPLWDVENCTSKLRERGNDKTKFILIINTQHIDIYKIR